MWRAVDHEGEILESYIARTRDKEAALTFMKKTLKRHGSPATIVTDGLKSYRATINDLGNAEKQEVGTPTTGRKTPIARSDDGNGRCSDSAE